MNARWKSDPSPRFGIGEWYGYQFEKLSNAERLAYATLQSSSSADAQPCPFRADGKTTCTKAGGVCSLRLYDPIVDPSTGNVVGGRGTVGEKGMLRVTCPYRFHETGEIFRWVGETILGEQDPLLASEIGFLQAEAGFDTDGGSDVGRIDMVLAIEDPLRRIDWCALEIQAVYFSGGSMTRDFRGVQKSGGAPIFPVGKRRPDYRSSGPKRLMPQLQIKVPTLRRWGKKMAVVVDRAFIDSMGTMDHVPDISNCDIAWFIVRLDDSGAGRQAKLVRDGVRYTTLERAVEGLTGGTPVTKVEFESQVRAKLANALAIRRLQNQSRRSDLE